jgi:serine/threonine protein kinase
MNNPYIMKFLDSRATNRNFYLMLEYCAIGDLEVVLTKNFELGFPEELA